MLKLLAYLAALRAAITSSILSSLMYLKSQVFRARASSCSALSSSSMSSLVTTDAPFFLQHLDQRFDLRFHLTARETRSLLARYALTTFMPRSASCLATPTRPTLALRDQPATKMPSRAFLVSGS